MFAMLMMVQVELNSKQHQNMLFASPITAPSIDVMSKSPNSPGILNGLRLRTLLASLLVSLSFGTNYVREEHLCYIN